MAHTHFSFTNPVWKRSESDKASRYFVTIEKNIADQIKALVSLQPRKGR
ncbi:hypothetical protein KAZ93_02435 [Patescibacteria group bacterium]|nr:hypothetical protein [Patescibacteria group bacterium]